MMSRLLFLLAVILNLLVVVSSEAIHITEQNYESIRTSSPLLFLNFYAEWCRYSQALKPIFDKTAEEMVQQHEGQVVLGRVDCEQSKVLCQSNFHITKYPTLKLLRNGQPAKKEYRGQRSITALSDYIRKQLEDPVKNYTDDEEFSRGVIGIFDSTESKTVDTFKMVASSLQDDCPFFMKSGPNSRIYFSDKEGVYSEFGENKEDFAELYIWAQKQCVPVVREITFTNGEELTEEGLPFVVLFRHPDDQISVRHYKEVIEQNLMAERAGVNFVYADGLKFAHPLSHLGKSKKDLPVIAIDSFRHMYVFPSFEDIQVPGKLKQFIDDLHSGKLHREFHHGADPTTANPATAAQIGIDDKSHESSPPESTFRKLRPAKSRYSLLRDEL